MKKVRFDKTETGYNMFVDNKRVDSLYESQIAQCLQKQFGYRIEDFEMEDNTDIQDYIDICSYDDKLMDINYRHLCSGVSAVTDWNGAMVERLAYPLYKRIYDAGFFHTVAFKIAISEIFMANVMRDSEYRELLDILKMYRRER